MNHTHRHSERMRGIFSFWQNQRSLRFAFGMAVLGLLALSSPLRAEDKKAEPAKEEPKAEANVKTGEMQDKPDNPFRFAPDFCDFEITFPETPIVAQKCIDNACYDVHSYTMVYDLQTTVDVTVTCSPSTPANYKRYTDQVLKAALLGMIDNRNLKSHDIRFEQFEKARSATLMGEGITGAQEKIYSGQLWVGQNSVFTVQGELVGATHDIADKSFGDILSSIKTKEGKQLPKAKRAPTVPKQNNQ